VTRINVVPVESLSRQHLVAEYREITRLPKNLKTSLSRKGKPFSMSEIPPEYKLGTGHVKFFFDKMQFLELRFKNLVDEMLRRGYNPSYMDETIFRDCPAMYYNNYEPTAEAIELNVARIKERTK
jgi:deoxyribonuclease (pyrimidine dimer)